MRGSLGNILGMCGAALGAAGGALAGFALVFYFCLMFNPSAAGDVTFAAPPPPAVFLGLPVGAALGGVTGYRLC